MIARDAHIFVFRELQPMEHQLRINMLYQIPCMASYEFLLFRRSEGFALTGYDIPGCVEDGAWMLWRNSSVVAVVVVAVARILVIFHQNMQF